MLGDHSALAWVTGIDPGSRNPLAPDKLFQPPKDALIGWPAAAGEKPSAT
jgi:hypothetical protein